jgi:hypothetical protein
MIDNLIELEETVQRAGKGNDLKLFDAVCHKVKATVEMLADPELSETIIRLKDSLADATKIALLRNICIDISESLRQEII